MGWRRGQRAVWLLKNDSGEVEPVPIPVRHELGDGEAMLHGAIRGVGLVQLPTWLVGDHLRGGKLLKVLHDLAAGEMPMHVIWPRTKYIQPRVRMVIDELVRLSAKANSGFRP